MRKNKVIIFPSYITSLYKDGDINLSQLLNVDGWPNIFSGNTVKKIKRLNNYVPNGDDESAQALDTLGLEWIHCLTGVKDEEARTATAHPSFKILKTLMEDGRETETELLTTQLFNFELTFTWEKALDGTYVILLSELVELDDICNRYVRIRSEMGELFTDMSKQVPHGDFVYNPIVQSYMKN